MSEWMSIGRFARATRLTVKALRHYDEIGLLRPAAVDPRSGYRRYASEQVGDATLIATLRALDVPLASISRVLRDRSALASTLEAERARIEREIDDRRRALAMLDRLVRGAPLDALEVRVRDEPARVVASVHVTTSAETLERDTTRVIRETLATLTRAGIDAGDPVMAIFGAPMDEESIPLEIAFGVPDDARIDVPGAQRVALPAARCAWVRHVGPYAELARAHHALDTWAEEQGIAASGALREIYVDDPDEVTPDALVTEVLLPIG